MAKKIRKNSNEPGYETQQSSNMKATSTTTHPSLKSKSNEKLGESSTQISSIANPKERTKNEVNILNNIDNPSNKMLEVQVQATEYRKTESNVNDLKSVPTPTNGSEMVTMINKAITYSVNRIEKIRNHSSGVYSKSSTGKSIDSIESNRSADTGVSLNIVKEISSAREKKGVHLEKRPQEIETLSGNVGHIHRNGESK